MTTDAAGNVYGAATTRSALLAMARFGPAGKQDIYVGKFNAQETLQWSAVIGGSAFDDAGAIAVDKDWNI